MSRIIMVDTNILVDFFNGPTAEYAGIFARNDVRLCGVVQAELLHGALSDGQVERIKDMFSGLGYIGMEASDWTRVGLLLLRLRKSGLKVPFPDAVIAELALRHGCEVWTRDKHFLLIKENVPELRLFTT